MLEQEYEPLEVIVVDGGSSDGSVDVIRRHEDRLAWWTSEPDRGQAHALNKGFARAGGEVLGWLASDDVLEPGAVARVVDELEQRPDVLLVYGEALFVDESGAELFPLEPRAVRRRGDGARVREPRRAAGLALSPPRLELAGPLNENGHYLFDFEFALAVGREGAVRAHPATGSRSTACTPSRSRAAGRC